MATASTGHTVCEFDIDAAKDDLARQGYAVIPKAITSEKCDSYIAKYKSFLKQFEEDKIPFESRKSVIQTYRVAHFAETWEIRLAVKQIFAKIWGTEKLLTSADGMAISKPPEDSDDEDEFYNDGTDWFHVDQAAHRKGLHAYQGAVYLEETTEMDHCFRVLKGSHLYHSDLFHDFPAGVAATKRSEFYKLNKKQKEWYKRRGCLSTKVPVPKGGLVLWDSRTVHDNVSPELGRTNHDRWRFVTFVSMTPAIWAQFRPQDIQKKQKAYDKMLITSHWSSQGLKTFKAYSPNSDKNKKVQTIKELPDIARTREARLLFGIESYKFDDGLPNGPKEPTWVES